MASTVVFENPCVTVWYHPDTKIVHHQIHKFVTGKDFQDFLLAGTEALRRHRAEKWLSDDRSNSVLSKQDREWADRNWLPDTVRAGWKYWAIVQPAKVLAQMGLQRIVERYSKAGLTAQFFSNPTDALTWLEKQ